MHLTREKTAETLERSTTRPRVLIADDHSVAAKMLGSLLEKSYEVIGVVQDGRQLLAEAASCSRGHCCQGNRTGHVPARKLVIGGLAAADPLPQRP